MMERGIQRFNKRARMDVVQAMVKLLCFPLGKKSSTELSPKSVTDVLCEFVRARQPLHPSDSPSVSQE